MEIKSLLVYPVLKSFVPLFIGDSYYFFKRTLSDLSLMGSNLNFNDIKQKLNYDSQVLDSNQMNPEEMPSDLLSMLNQVSFGIYTNFFAFLLVMLFIDILVRMIHLGVKDFWKEARYPRLFIDDDHSYSSSFFQKGEVFFLMYKKQIIKILAYSLIFISLQIAGLCFESFAAQNETSGGVYQHRQAVPTLENSESFQIYPETIMMNDEKESYFGIPRILEEEEEVINDKLTSTLPTSLPLTSDKISLSMGNVLSSLNLNVNAMVISKDRKTAYVTLDLYGTLKVIDISDLQSPFVRASLNLQTTTYLYQIKNLLLSSDEKTLYASNTRNIEIIDISDRDSPKLLSLTKSEIFADSGVNAYYGLFKTALAVEEETKTLYIGGIGLQVYDISDPEKPILLKAVRNDASSVFSITRNDLSLSRDGKTLFFTNGALGVYDISDPKDMKLLYSLETESSPRSIMLLEDDKTVFLLGATKDYQIIFEEVDISDYKSPFIRRTVKLGKISFTTPFFLAASPNKSKFFILSYPSYSDIDLLVFDRVKQTTIKNEKSLIEKTLAMNFSPDGRTLITASNGQFRAIELSLDYPNRQIFSESLDNFISKFPVDSHCSWMQISNDGKYLFIVRLGLNAASIFEIWEVKDPTEPKLLSTFNWLKLIKQIHLTKDQETVYLLGEKSLLVLDIKDRSSFNEKKTYEIEDKDKRFWHFTTSVDEKIGFMTIIQNGVFGDVTTFNLSDTSPPKIKANGILKKEFDVSNSKVIVKDEKTLILTLQQTFSIYDISNLNSPVPLASVPFGLNEPDPETTFTILSPDQKTLYIETSDKSGFHKLKAYDLSILASPQLLSEKYFSKIQQLYQKPGFSLSPVDLKSGFIYQNQNNSLVKLDLKSPKEIKISGVIPLVKKKGTGTTSYIVSPDGQTLYACSGMEIHIFNMNIKYSFFLNQEKFLLGEKYSGKVNILKLAGASDYNVLDSGAFKITKLSLLDFKVAPSQPAPEITKDLLPSWITFDSEGDTLTVDAKKQRDIGTYILHSAFSLKIPRDIWKKLPVSSKDLWAWLISLDYVDNELFLTANFGSEDDFFLPEKFENHTKEIYSTLKQYSVETSTLFEIVSSLEMKKTEESNISISTLSTNAIKIEVSLHPKNRSDVKFVSCPYGPIVPIVKNNNKTKISLEGSLKEINSALNSIVVNFENGTSCDATIVINDGFNPTISVELTNISRYFKPNTPPFLNQNIDKTVQEQIDSADIQTGKYFTFTLTNDIFEDDFAETLDYELKMAQKNTAFPNWLSLSGLTLKGTPPQEVLGRDTELILIAKNEFKRTEVPITLHANISLALYLQLVLKYIPYVLTIVGLLVSANKIWNIFGSKHYKHFKDFYLGAGQEITSTVIEPIVFIKEEIEQSQVILKYLEKMVKGDSLLMSVIDPNTNVLNKQIILEKIQEAVNQMSSIDRKKLTKYPSSIIEKIIVNRFILMQLETKNEVQTKILFKELESDCMEIVERDLTSAESLTFTINQNKLNELIERIRPKTGELNETLEESLVRNDVPEGVNINLLKEVILALAFENHTLDILPVNLDIGVKQKIPANFLFRFLKLDLRDIYLSEKTKINYGINYQIIDDKLCFYGVTQNYFKGKTLIVQVKNLHQRIMKEIWIHGVERDETFIIRDEHENRGQGYEIY